MVNKIKKQTHRFLWGSLVVLIIVCIFVFSWITSMMVNAGKDTVSKAAHIYMEEISAQYQNHFNTLVDLRYQQIHAIIDAYPPENVQSLDEEAYRRLTRLGQSREFTYMALYDKMGDEFVVYGDSLEIENKATFIDTMNKGELLIGTGKSKNGERVLLYGTSVGYPKEKGYPLPDGRLCTAMVVGIQIDKLNEALSLNGDDSIVFSHIIENNGDFVIQNDGAVTRNYFGLLNQDVDFMGQDKTKIINEFKKAVADRDTYALEVSVDGEDCHIYCKPLDNSKWSLITVMPYGELDDVVSELANNQVFVAIVGCGILLTAAIIIFSIYFYLSHKQIKAIEKAQHEAEYANRAKSEFLSNMSHDIRTPMNAIVGLTTIANRNIDNKEQVENCLHKIALSSKHLLGLINDVLDMSKIESGKLNLNLELVSLQETMESIVNIVQPQIKSKQQNFNISIKNIISEQVFCDGVRLNQVLINLLSNALKFTPEKGSIQVIVKQEESPKGDAWVRTHFWVEDNGIGMTPEFQKRIFESFVREDNKRVHKTEGSGLGMTITKYIVDKMDGTIDVESELDVGTKFHVVLDFEKADIEENEMKLPDWKILIADDNEDLCISALQSFKELGIEAEYECDENKAIERIKACYDQGEKYDIILIDWKMPNINGIETAKEIRKIIKDDGIIILISANDYCEVEEAAKQAGINGFIAKPLFPSTLYRGLLPYIDCKAAIIENDEPQTDFSNIRILLAEDNDINWEIANELLSEQGFTVDWAENGQQCVEMFSEKEQGYYQIILMDIRMPVMDGYQATSAIRNMENRPDGKDIPILAMTADAFVEDINRCLETGMNDHLAKPLDINELIRKIEKYIK